MQQQLFRRDHSTQIEELFHPPGKSGKADFPRLAHHWGNQAEVFCLGWPTTGGHPKGLA
jgi:hypothetical protein